MVATTLPFTVLLLGWVVFLLGFSFGRRMWTKKQNICVFYYRKERIGWVGLLYRTYIAWRHCKEENYTKMFEFNSDGMGER